MGDCWGFGVAYVTPQDQKYAWSVSWETSGLLEQNKSNARVGCGLWCGCGRGRVGVVGDLRRKRRGLTGLLTDALTCKTLQAAPLTPIFPYEFVQGWRLTMFRHFPQCSVKRVFQGGTAPEFQRSYPKRMPPLVRCCLDSLPLVVVKTDVTLLVQL